jgi:hypothetical protein
MHLRSFFFRYASQILLELIALTPPLPPFNTAHTISGDFAGLSFLARDDGFGGFFYEPGRQ